MRLSILLTGVLLAIPAYAQQGGDKTTVKPTLELLEFLAEFGEIEDLTFEIIELHATKDLGSGKGDNSARKQQVREQTNEK